MKIFITRISKFCLRVYRKLQVHCVCWASPDVVCKWLNISPKDINCIDWETDYTRWSSVIFFPNYSKVCVTQGLSRSTLVCSVLGLIFHLRYWRMLRSSQILVWKCFQLVLRKFGWVYIIYAIFWSKNLSLCWRGKHQTVRKYIKGQGRSKKISPFL